MRNFVSYRSNHRAFSLLELMVVLVIMGILAGILSVRWSGILRPLTTQDSLEKIVQFDRKVRTFARTERVRGTLWYDEETSTLRAELFTTPTTRLSCQLPSSIDVALVTQGSNSIVYTRTGVSVDYSVDLQINQTSASIRFVGLTGQTVVQKSE